MANFITTPFFRSLRVLHGHLSQFLALVGVLVALGAQAQADPIVMIGDDVNMGTKQPGSTYTAKFAVIVGGSATMVSASVEPAPGRPTSVTSISPTSAFISPGPATIFEVTLVIPSTPGWFTETIVFKHNASSGVVTQRRVIGGYAGLPGESYWVGVIPSAAGCPTGSSLITVHMDDEDRKNENNRGGWLGATTSDRNTTLRFCRVDGRDFLPLATTNVTVNHYAVLKLGTTCPNGSRTFRRLFDNEDTRNENWMSTSSGNLDDLQFIRSERNNSWTILDFCSFKAGLSTMSDFPELGIQYGVFAAEDFSKALETGWVFTDDEDRNPRNDNEFSGDSEEQRLITPTNSDGRNTTIHMTRVR